jgi:integrin beta 3
MTDDQMLERVAAEVRGFVSRQLAPLLADVDKMRQALRGYEEQHALDLRNVQRQIEQIELQPGPAGKDGMHGKDGAPGRDGVDGKDGSDGAPGKDGAPGRDGIDGKDGRDGLHGKDGLPGKDGRDGTDGQPGLPGSDGRPGAKGEPGADGVDGRDGLHGKDGRDAMQIDDFDARLKDGRTLELSFTLSDGQVQTKDIVLRGMVVDAGVYRSEAGYVQGDAVTYAGSYWIAQRDTRSAPGNGSTDWRLCVKRGRDGRDGGAADGGGAA